VLSTHNSKETKAILNAVRAFGHEPVWIRNENIRSQIRGNSIEKTPSIDVLINRQLLTKSEKPLEELQLADIFAENVPVLNHPADVSVAIHKFRAELKLARAGLPVPDAYYARSHQTLEEWSEALAPLATHKQTIGTNGRAMSVVSADDPISPTIRNRQSFLQEFLDTGAKRPSDIRVYVVGDRVIGAMRRYAPEGEWRTNVAIGGEPEDVTDEIGDELRELSVAASDVLGLDVAGVDLISTGGDWKILEVNATAGFRGLYGVTGRSPAPYIAQLALERAGESVPDSAVTELAAELDDSVPECKPTVNDDGDGDRVLGYTNHVEVSGTDGAESCVAKADTGARRTSIDTELAGRVGAGPLVGTTQVRRAASRESETRPLVDIRLRIDDRWRTVTASITDRQSMTHPVLLGRDVLEEYTLDISRRIEE